MIWTVRWFNICSAEEKAIRSSCNIASVECRCRWPTIAKDAYAVYITVVDANVSAAHNSGYNIAKAPLYFVRSGYVFINIGRLGYAGTHGNGWSLTAGYYTSVTDARASYLSFNADGVSPSSNSDRWYGLSLR